MKADRENLEPGQFIVACLAIKFQLDDVGNFYLCIQVSQPSTLLDNLSQSCQVLDVVFIYPSDRV